MACNDDGDDAANDAQGLAGDLEQFSNTFNGTDDLVQASDDVKDDLKSGCSDLQDGVDSDALDNFCDDLGDAVDDDDQAAFTALKGQWPSTETEVRADIAADIGDAADDGDDGDNDDDADNPLDDEDGDTDSDGDGEGDDDEDEDDNPVTQ
jgi:hypothetical protein